MTPTFLLTLETFHLTRSILPWFIPDNFPRTFMQLTDEFSNVSGFTQRLIVKHNLKWEREIHKLQKNVPKYSLAIASHERVTLQSYNFVGSRKID